jgi:tetratricopeptide (TPR) repeat protein
MSKAPSDLRPASRRSDYARRAWVGLLAAGLTLSAALREPLADVNDAKALFQRARSLLKQGKVAEACAMMAEAQQQSPASAGILLNLGDCHERQGKLATARAEFLTASHLAGDGGDEGQRDEAQRRASLLEPRLSRLTVRVEAAVPGLVVRHDGAVIDSAQFGTPLAVDLGEHVFTAEAPGYEPFRTTAQVQFSGHTSTVSVPALTKAQVQTPGHTSTASVPALAKQSSSRSPTYSALGYASGGLGVAALGVGAAFGLAALSSHARADDLCSTSSCPDQAKALDEREKSKTQALVSDLGVGLGLVGLAAGAYFLFFAPSERADAGAKTSASVSLVPGPGGGALGWRF